MKRALLHGMMILLAVTVQTALLVGGISLALFRARAKTVQPALASWSTPIVAHAS